MHDTMHTPGPRPTVGRGLAVLSLLLITAIGGCASPAKFQPVSGAENFPAYEGDVKVLENLPPSSQYKRVGVVVVDGVQLTKDSDMITILKEEAAARGADAVVMQGPVKVTKEPDGGTTKKVAAWAIRLNR